MSIDQHLIWQPCAPSPFESAWSIFAKLLALNEQRPHEIVRLIAGSDVPLPRRGGLNFRTSDWIDFQRFGKTLKIDSIGLRAAFLDQLGFEIKAWPPGIKICPECLSMGYHCIFFELIFIDTCPWHHRKLEEPCVDCMNAVMDRGLINLNTNYKETIHPEGWRSKCNHIHIEDDDIRRLNQLSDLQEEAIFRSCHEFLQWWRLVSQNVGIAKALSDTICSRLCSPEILNKFFNAAESLAGPCPWPVGQVRMKIKSHSWRQQADPSEAKEYKVARKSPEDANYRSVRRHLFNRYIRPHRACWNELMSYSQADTQFLDSDTVCPASLAYAAWRMATEGFINIRALKVNSLKHLPIRLMSLNDKRYVSTLASHTSLLYAHFLFIWESIFRFSGQESFAIAISSHYDDSLATMFISDGAHSDRDAAAGEWTVILPDIQSLINRSFTTCCGRLKTEACMLYPRRDNWYAYFEIDRASYSGALFKLKKEKLGRRRAQYHYINI